jgi:probable rRNA maturation factor
VLEGLCSFLRIECEEISVYFVSEKKICELHAEFFNDPSPTDCISFPVDDDYLGDIFISPLAANRYDPARPYEEVLLYLVHGILHLIGFDDVHANEKRSMRKMEKKCMDHLKQCKLKITP